MGKLLFYKKRPGDQEFVEALVSRDDIGLMVSEIREEDVERIAQRLQDTNVLFLVFRGNVCESAVTHVLMRSGATLEQIASPRPQAPPHRGDTPDQPAMTRPALYAEIDALKAELAEARAELAPIPDASVCSIVAAYLRKHGYDGLYDEKEAPDCCACCLETGLMDDCGGQSGRCIPGYRVPCDCPGNDHSYHVVCSKEASHA